MPRKPREQFKGALFYVTAKGRDARLIFESDEGKRQYLALITHYKQVSDFKLYAWIILTDEVHLLIEMGDTPLSKIMQGIQQGYTRWYTKRFDHVGPVFDQRYTSHLCHKERYLLPLIRLIHQNPTRLKKAEDLDYPWSGHLAYTKGIRTDITDILYPLSLFSDKREQCRGLYQLYLSEEASELYSMKKSGLSEGVAKPKLDLDKGPACQASVEDIIEVVLKHTGVTIDVLYSNSRRPQVAFARRLILLFCLKYTAYRQFELAKKLKITESAISKSLLEPIKSDSVWLTLKKHYGVE